MEILRYPHISCYSILQWHGFAVGPLNRELKIKYEYLPFQSAERWMAEGKGAFHENFVDHIDSDGDITYSPGYQMSKHSPTAMYPDRVLIPVVGKQNPIEFPLGYAEECGYGVHNVYGKYGSGTRHYIIEKCYNGTFMVKFCVCGTRPDQIMTWAWYDMDTLVPKYPSQATGTVTVYNLSKVQTVDVDMHSHLSFEVIKRLCPPRPEKGSTGTSYWNIWDLSTTTWLSPSALRDYTSHRCLTQSMGTEYLPAKHDGDLCNEAVQKLKANDVNMLCFLRDLRNPMQLVPKIRNLLDPKVAANNYLAVKYGILPTISDVQKIRRAVTKAKRRANSAGETVVGRAYKASKVVDDVTFTLEQHAKVRIGNTDTGLQSAINGLESSGFAPTLKHIWELIPYSFCIDWLVNVADLLDRVDGIHRLLRYPIRVTTLSIKRTARITFVGKPDQPIYGFISLRRYRRWSSVRTPLPPLSLQESADALSHWLEASALIIQRAKK